jgi:hypothetical protein
MCVFSVFMFVAFCVALCVSVQRTCDEPICSPRIPTSDMSSKIQKQEVSDPGEHFFKKITGTEVENCY